jgi:carbonic anhydrase
MSIFTSSTSWTANCNGSQQSPINLTQTSAKPCSQLCELAFDDVYIQQAYAVVSDEGLILQSTSGLGTCKFNGEGYTCNTLLVNHPSHHTVENIQFDAEVIAIFQNPTSGYLCVSSMVRVSPTQNISSHFFNAFVAYGNPSVANTAVNLGEQWGLFMMVPTEGSYFVYTGSMVVPPCQQVTWVVFNSQITIDTNDFATLIKNVSPGSRPIQPLGSRELFFNDTKQLTGGPMPKDGKTYMRCKRSGKTPDVKPVQKTELSKNKPAKKNVVHEWVSNQVNQYGYMSLFEALIQIGAILLGIYLAYTESKNPTLLYPILLGQSLARWIRSFFVKSPLT